MIYMLIMFALSILVMAGIVVNDRRSDSEHARMKSDLEKLEDRCEYLRKELEYYRTQYTALHHQNEKLMRMIDRS